MSMLCRSRQFRSRQFRSRQSGSRRLRYRWRVGAAAPAAVLAASLAVTGALAVVTTSAVAVAPSPASARVPRVAAPATVPLPHEDPFYTYSGTRPLAKIARGTVLDTRSVQVGVPGTGAGAVPGTQILYRTQDELRRPSVTVTTVLNPTGPVSKGLLGYLSFYDALGDVCDPSYTLQGGDPGADNQELADTETALVTSLASQGYAVTVPDFEGTDLHWVAGQESGWNTLDSLRATESFLHLASSTKVGMFGYSGGSIAGDWAAELAPTYAPSLNIVGTAIGGVPVDLAHNLRYVNGSDDWSGVIPAVLVSVSRAFGLDLATYASPYGLRVAAQVQDQCIGSFNGNYPGLRVARLLQQPYKAFLKVPVFARIINKLLMGTAPGHPLTPMYLGVGNADGTGDHVMIADDVMALGHEYCSQGVPVQFNEYANSEHSQAGLQFFPAAEAYLAAAFAGAAPSNCADIGPGNSLAPLKVGPPGH